MNGVLNGVPRLSLLEGQAHEGWIEGRTGRAVCELCDKGPNDPNCFACVAASIYHKLERVILPFFN